MTSTETTSKVIDTIDITTPPNPVEQSRRIPRRTCSRANRIDTITALLKTLYDTLSNHLKKELTPRRARSIHQLERNIAEYQRQLAVLTGDLTPSSETTEKSDLAALATEVAGVIRELNDDQEIQTHRTPVASPDTSLDETSATSPNILSDNSHYETVSDNDSSNSEEENGLLNSTKSDASSESDHEKMSNPLPNQPQNPPLNPAQNPPLNPVPNPAPNPPQNPPLNPAPNPPQNPPLNPAPNNPNPAPNPLGGAGAPTFDQWKDYADANTTALIEGMTNLNAVAFKQEIPEFTGELNDGVTIDEWLKMAKKVALAAGWNNAQQLKYFQDRLTKSAANFNDSLTVPQKATFPAWEAAIVNGFQDNAVKMLRKAQLKQLRQNPNERIRDFKKRIDDIYKVAYGDAVTNSLAPEVISLRNEIKKEILLNGVRPEIASIIWGRLRPNADFESSVLTAIECEQIIEIRRVAECKMNNAVLLPALKKKSQQEEIDELKELVHQMAREKLTSGNHSGRTENTVAFIGTNGARPRTEFFQGRGYQRSRSHSPGYQRFNNPPNDRQSSSHQVRFSDTARQVRSPSPGFRQSNYQQTTPTYSNYNQQTTPTYNSYPQRSTEPGNPQQAVQWNKETRSCFFCKNRGHIKRECRKYKVWKQKDAQSREKSNSQTQTQA